MAFLGIFSGILGVLLYISLIVWLAMDATFKGSKLIALLLVALGFTVEICILRVTI